MKVLWIFSHPAPYKIAFFNVLGEKTDLTVLFERNAEGDRPPEFYYGKAKNFKMEILHSLKLGVYNSFYPSIIRRIKKETFDIIVINGYATFTEMKLIRYLDRHKIPYVIAINGGIAKTKESSFKKKTKTRYLSRAKMYLCPDENSRDYLIHYGAEKEKIRFYPYSTIHESDIVDKALDEEEKAKLRLSSGLKENKLFVTAASLSRRKNILELICLFGKAPKEYRLIIMGTGELEKECREYISLHQLDNIEIYPFLSHDDVLRYFAMASFTILWSKEDIYGHVVNESLSQGTPVISSPHSNAAKHLIKDGENGYLLSLEDEKSFLETLDKPYTFKMGEHCIEVARENTIEKMAEVHLEHFKEFLE